jgi:hypothetical protein
MSTTMCGHSPSLIFRFKICIHRIAEKIEGLVSYSEQYCYYVQIVECGRRDYYFWQKIWTYQLETTYYI